MLPALCLAGLTLSVLKGTRAQQTWQWQTPSGAKLARLVEVQQSLRGCPLPERLVEVQQSLTESQTGSPWLQRLVAQSHHCGARLVRLRRLSLPTLEGRAQAERAGQQDTGVRPGAKAGQKRRGRSNGALMHTFRCQAVA